MACIVYKQNCFKDSLTVPKRVPILLLEFSFPFVRSFVCPHFLHASYMHRRNDGVGHTACAPEGREGRSPADPKGPKLDVGG